MDIPPGAAQLQSRQKSFAPQHSVGLQSEFLIVADILAGLALIYFLTRAQLMWAPDGWRADRPRELVLLSVIGALMLREPALSRPRAISLAGLVEILIWRVGVSLAALLLGGIAMRGNDTTSLQFLALFGTWALASRLIFFLYMRHLLARGPDREAVAVMGSASAAGRIAARVAADADVVAVIKRLSADELDDALDDDAELDGFTEVAVLARAGDIDTVILALDQDNDEDIEDLVQRLQALPVELAICPETEALPPTDNSWDKLLDLHMTVIADRPVQRWGRLVKALMDRVGAGLLLLVLLPVIVAVALAIACDSPGPILFRQRRSGWAGRTFTLYKFRTMFHGNTRAPSGQTQRNDPRCTRVGAILRRTSLDELPQLWNVLTGEMSLVGPRPHAENLHVRERSGCALVAEYAQRQRVKPGMTGWAQVHDLRGAIGSAEQLRARVEYDLYYIDHWSLLLDLRILARTPLSVLRGENAF